MLQGKRLILRALARQDLAISLKWVNDWDICRGLLRYSPVSEPEHFSWFASAKGDKNQVFFGIALKRGGKYIGNIGLRNINWKDRNGDFYIFIGDKKNWNKGLATEAAKLFVDYCFKVLNLHKIYLRVIETNKSAWRAYEKVGFLKEGLLKEEVFAEGSYHDVIRMAIINSKKT